MTAARNHVILFAVLFSFVLSGCRLFHHEKRDFLKDGNYERAILKLETAEQKQPDNWRVKQNLGIAYYKTGQLQKATTKLNQALTLNTKSIPALLYSGLSYEALASYQNAASAYRSLKAFNISADLKQELFARIRENERKEILQRLRRKIAKNQNTPDKNVNGKSVAVLYFHNVSNWTQLNPLLKGLTDLLISDLASMKQLKVVRREELQFLLDDLQLPYFHFTNNISIPEIGKYLNCKYAITGGIERFNDTNIRINAGIVDVQTGKLLGSGIKTQGSISDLPGIEKDLLLKIIATFGIVPDQREKQMLQQYATKNTLALIAYSKGLDYDDRSREQLARDAYSRAVSLDKSFTLARMRLQQLPEKRLSNPEMERLIQTRIK